MSIYPNGIDSDASIIRIDDQISELGGEAINQLRDAVFAIEGELGIGLRGSMNSFAERVNVSLNSNGTIKASALTAVGLVTLPITDNQVASNAGIKEYKLALNHSTSDLYTLITSNATLLNSLITFTDNISSDFTNHLKGATFLSDGTTSARHVASQIDLNIVGTDSRDPFFTWSGLLDKFGTLRSAETVGSALLQINNDLTGHENATEDAHTADSINVDVSQFIEIPTTATTVQKVIDYLNDAEVLNIGEHRAVQHANCIPRIARSDAFDLPDGYGPSIVPSTPAITYLVHQPNTSPVDDLSVGDDIIKFVPSNNNFVFDSQFTQVRVGDVARVNYGNGIEIAHKVESIRYTPGTEWIIRIDGTNIFDDGYASVRIDRPEVDFDTAGVLAVAAANATPTASFSNKLSGVIVGHPRAASILGLEFDSNQLDSSHYLLYLELYPTGNPAGKIIILPGIDVTGNAGITPGSYTLEDIIQETNNSLRQIGYNYRFIAFDKDGEFGIMLADAIGGASFAIISGVNSAGSISTGVYTNNVIGGSTVDDFDALGFGSNKIDIASPTYQSSFADTTSAQLPTKIISPRKRRHFIVNGQKHDTFFPTYLANSDGYWDGYISARTPVAAFTVETTYTVLLDLEASGLRPGKTIVIQPSVGFSDPTYSDVDYGRFIIKNVNFIASCGGSAAMTQITVINGLHGTGSGFGFSSGPQLPVHLYFSYDSVHFDNEEVIDSTPATLEYHRLHEIYIDQTGKTFSHERARLPRQAEDSTAGFLATDRWHIKGVGSKLRGYRDGNPLIFNKFIRFYILSYDSTSGIFDGYLGKRISAISSQITKTGQVVTGRKNTVIRFYDETNVDWIDLEFIDNSSPGISILGTASPRWVDIELFPSLASDASIMQLATCEVNWSPASGQDIVERVRDTRQFGSIDETNFTESAIDFISTGDRLLHENGIVQGFAFDTINSTDNRELYFKGGVAIVNGKIITANNQPVTIPQIYQYGTTLPQTMQWAVCINENNDLVPIIITSTKTQLFATSDGVASYYVPSVTFLELVTTRKDLCPIALVTAHIASFTITPSIDILDVRKFVQNGNAAAPLTVTSDQSSGSFHTFDAVKNWINNFGGMSNLVRVKGTFDIDTSSIDLTEFNYPVIFEGDGAVFNVTIAKGIVIGSDVTLRNLAFNYTPPAALSYTSGDMVNSGNGCIYGASSTTVDLLRIKIQDCTFSSSLSQSQRPPYINLEINNGQTLQSLNILNNSFSDSSDTASQAAIAILTINNATSTDPAIFRNSKIANNTCDRIQGIFATIAIAGGLIARPGLNIIDVVIEMNQCGTIGYLSTSVGNSLTTQDNPSSGLTIQHNTCHYIETAMGNGVGFLIIFPPYDFGLGQVSILNNYCNWIHVVSQDGSSTDSTNDEFSNLQIKNNVLTAFDFAYIFNIILPMGIANNTAIIVGSYPTSAAGDITSCTITGNSISTGMYNDGTSYTYLSGIYANCSAIIDNNIIKGFAKSSSAVTDGYGIIAAGATVGNAIRKYTITNNQIYRGTATINGYIAGTTSASFPSIGTVVDNIFDSTTIDGSSTVVVAANPKTWTVARNKNQTDTILIAGESGMLKMGHSGSIVTIGTPVSGVTIATDNTIPVSSLAPAITITYSADSATITSFVWLIPVNTIIPRGALISSISITVASDTVFNTTGSINLVYKTSTIGTVTKTVSLVSPYVATTQTTVSIVEVTDFTVNTGLIAPAENTMLSVSGSFAHNAAVTLVATVSPITITYRW